MAGSGSAVFSNWEKGGRSCFDCNGMIPVMGDASKGGPRAVGEAAVREVGVEGAIANDVVDASPAVAKTGERDGEGR